jgi:guanylate kinase
LEVIEKRIAKAEYELTFASQFDLIIINEHLEIAFSEAEKCIREFIASCKPQAARS